MPSIANMPIAAPTRPTTQVQTEEPERREVQRPVIYPEECAEIKHRENAITERDAEIILDWLPESQYQTRMMRKQPGTEASAWSYGEVYMLKDADGNKVRCLNNLDNRPFDERWCAGLTQTILRFQWAGPTTITDLVQYVYGKAGMESWTSPSGRTYNIGDMIEMASGTINGSSISLSRTGRVESGQHSLCALKKACQMYRKGTRGTLENNYEDGDYPEWDRYLAANAHKHDFGTNGSAPVLETILVFGLSEDRRVLMTVDNCKPRSEADVFYTSDIFVKLRDFPGKRKEMSRMLAVCCDWFWKRTKRQGYKTHSEVMGMVVDHPKLIKCVEHLFACNAEVVKDRTKPVGKDMVGGHMIANLGLSAGQCSALMYLMASSDSDGDEYRNNKPAPREKGLDFGHWDAAKSFWLNLVGIELRPSSNVPLWTNNREWEPVRRALLVKAVNDEPLTGNLAMRAKLRILMQAWIIWRDEQRQFTELDLQEGGMLFLNWQHAHAETVTLADGTLKTVEHPTTLLDEPADFSGIDVPDQDAIDDNTPQTQEEIAASAEQIRQQRQRAAQEQEQRARESQDATPMQPRRPRIV